MDDYLYQIRQTKADLAYTEKGLKFLRFRVELQQERVNETRKDLHAVIVQAWEAGISQSLIAKELGISRQRVCKLLRTNGTTRYYPEKASR